MISRFSHLHAILNRPTRLSHETYKASTLVNRPAQYICGPGFVVEYSLFALNFEDKCTRARAQEGGGAVA